MSFFTKKVGCCCCVCFPKIFVGIYILSIQQYWRSSIYTTTQLLQPVPAFLADLFMFFLRSRATAAAIHSASKLLDTQYRLHSTFVYSIYQQSTLRGRTSAADRGPSCTCLLYTIYTALSSAICCAALYYYYYILRSRSVKVGFYAGHSHTYTTVKIGTQVLWPVSRLLAFFGSWPPAFFSIASFLQTVPESVRTQSILLLMLCWLV